MIHYAETNLYMMGLYCYRLLPQQFDGEFTGFLNLRLSRS